MPKLTAISPENFASKAWKRIAGYHFAAQLSTIPVVAAELPHLVPSMPLGFVQNGSCFELAAICSVQVATNLYVDPDGRWLGSYIPAAIRGYPFRLVKVQEREDSILCIDEESGVLVEAGQGEPFFDDASEASQPLKDVLNLLTQVDLNRVVTQAAVDALQTAGVIQPWPINLQQDDQVVAVEGLFRIDEAAMNALPDDEFLKLRRVGAFALAFAQLLSMNQLANLQKLGQAQAELKAQAAAQLSALSDLENFSMFQDDGTITFSY